jgi:integrase
MRFTNENAAAITAAKVRREVPDDGCPGLYLIVQPTGSKSLAVRYRRGNKWGKATLGKFGLGDGELRFETKQDRWARLEADPDSVSPDAREAARAVLNRLAMGEDPTAKTEGPTDLFRNVWRDYSNRHLAKRRPATAKAAQTVFKNRLQGWLEKPVKTISKRDVLDVLDAYTSAGHDAGAIRARAVLSKFFSWCQGRDLIRISPCDGIEPPTTGEGKEGSDSERFLNDAEIKTFWQACDATPYPFGPMFKLLLTTGCRREEIAAMRDSEINLDARTLTLQPNRTKNKRTHIVHLSDMTLSIIEDLDRVANDKGYIFSTNGRSFATGYSKAKSRLDKLMGDVPAWRLHDLRRTMVSGMARIGTPLHVVERCVNHVSGSFAGVVGIYQRHDFADECAQAWDAWSRHIGGVLSGQSSNVIPMTRPVA